MVRVQAEPFDAGSELARLGHGRTDIGAVASFVGLVRDEHGGEPVTAMTLEHYPGMTERAARADRGRGAAALAVAGQPDRAPGRADAAGRADRAGGDRVSPPPRRARGLRLPDRLAEDRGPVLEARGDPVGRALGRGPGRRRRGGDCAGPNPQPDGRLNAWRRRHRCGVGRRTAASRRRTRTRSRRCGSDRTDPRVSPPRRCRPGRGWPPGTAAGTA